MKSQHAGLVHSSQPWEGPAAPAFPLCPCTVFQDRTQLLTPSDLQPRARCETR